MRWCWVIEHKGTSSYQTVSCSPFKRKKNTSMYYSLLNNLNTPLISKNFNVRRLSWSLTITDQEAWALWRSLGIRISKRNNQSWVGKLAGMWWKCNMKTIEGNKMFPVTQLRLTDAWLSQQYLRSLTLLSFPKHCFGQISVFRMKSEMLIIRLLSWARLVLHHIKTTEALFLTRNR